MRTPSLPNLAGLGLRSPHLAEVLSEKPTVAWWEVHSENYFGGGAPLAALKKIRADYPVSLHGVGLGLGNLDVPDAKHLADLENLIHAIEPAAISEHLCWNQHRQRWFNDLLPAPRYKGVIEIFTRNIDIVQNRLQRQLLLENVSAYVEFADEAMSEAELLRELVQRTGCGLLLDLNNLYVNQLNHGLNARCQMQQLPLEAVGEIHIAGYEVFDGVVIDTHGARVKPEVIELLQWTLAQTGSLPVLLERDTQLPPWPELLAEYQGIVELISINQAEMVVA